MESSMMSFTRSLTDESAMGNDTNDASNTNQTTTVMESNSTDIEQLEKAEEEHEYDAVTTLFLNLCLICCLMLSYYVKKFRIYSFPESTGALLVGVVIGGIARLSTENLTLFEFVSLDLDFYVQCTIANRSLAQSHAYIFCTHTSMML